MRLYYGVVFKKDGNDQRAQYAEQFCDLLKNEFSDEVSRSKEYLLLAMLQGKVDGIHMGDNYYVAWELWGRKVIR